MKLLEKGLENDNEVFRFFHGVAVFVQAHHICAPPDCEWRENRCRQKLHPGAVVRRHNMALNGLGFGCVLKLDNGKQDIWRQCCRDNS